MKVYFSVSLSQMTTELRNACNLICDSFEALGHVEHFERRFNNKTNYQTKTEQENYLEQQHISKQKREADVIVVEITKPSIGIGQEICLGLLNNKYVIALHDEKTKPHVLSDINTDKLITLPYSEQNIKEVVADAMSFVDENQNQRFNLILNHDLVRYLDEQSTLTGKSKADLIRGMIVSEMSR